MTADELRKLVKAAPFVPFRLRLADGRHFDVPHPEFILVPHRSSVAVVEDDTGFELISLPIVVSAEVRPAQGAA